MLKQWLCLFYFNLSFLFTGRMRQRLIARSIKMMPTISPAFVRAHLLPPPLEAELADGALAFLLLRAARVSQARDQAGPKDPLINQIIEDWADSRAQLFQDAWVLSEFRGKRNGYFVEFGATDGVEKSNTYLLETKYGWTGILAEPNPDWHKSLAVNRPGATIVRDCVWIETGKTVQFQISENAELAGISKSNQNDQHSRNILKTISVNTISLYDLLNLNNAPAYIDFLSIDTEGSELEILAAYPFADAPKIRLIAVEHNFLTEKLAALDALLEPWGYRRVYAKYSAFDAWYVLQEEAQP
jgi:FkbM family methyltransferase